MTLQYYLSNSIDHTLDNPPMNVSAVTVVPQVSIELLESQLMALMRVVPADLEEGRLIALMEVNKECAF